MLGHDIIPIVNNAETPPFLRLPPSVRQRIYLHVGLITTGASGRPCVLDLHGHNQSLHLSFHGLLVSCRTIYTEASDILYSANRFNIRYWDKKSLEPLRNLRPRSLSNLTYLKIILNEAACHGRHVTEAWSGWRASLDHEEIATHDEDEDFLVGHNAPLRKHQPLTSALLTEWASTVAHLSSGITTQQLELCVVCDVDSSEVHTARRVTEPLSQLPQLKNCHLRLSRTSTPELNDIARHTSLKLRGLDWPQEPPASRHHHDSPQLQARGPSTGSRLLDLPRELRFRILEYTDLITPYEEVTWNRQHRAFLGFQTFYGPLEGRPEDRPPRFPDRCRFVDCWEPYPGPHIGCFCRVKHSAFSSTCMCWTPPQYLFLVCRTLYEDSLVVFYSGNRFVIHDYDHGRPFKAPRGLYPSPRLAASIFFTDVVPEHCLRELRFVELVFPPYSHEGWPNEAALNDWSHTMSLIRNKLNLPGLTLRLIMTGLYGYQAPENRLTVTEEQGNRIIAGYSSIMAPMACLGSDGLAKFHCRLMWPWACTLESEAMSLTHGHKWVTAQEMVLEDHHARLVMGDRYDSLQCGSGEPTDSSWVRHGGLLYYGQD